MIVGVRNRLFDWGVLKSSGFDIPLISVGNLAVGGTGKTPHTEYLIRLLGDKYRVAVLSRGYGRRTSGYLLATPHSTAQTIGDEPYQMYAKFPALTLAVDEDRCRGIRNLLALNNPPVGVILLDDAFQHRYVKPGLSILLTDYHRLFCDDAMLPAGRLREPVSGKNRAQIIVVTKCPADIKPIDFNIVAKRLNLYPYQRLYFSTFRYGNLRAVFPSGREEERPLSSLGSVSVLLLTGIASPASLFEKLREYAREVESLAFSDHHEFTQRDMELVAERFNALKGERLVVTTEKDAVRLIHHSSVDEGLKPYIYALPVEVEILQDKQDKFNQHIINYVRKNTRNRSLSEAEGGGGSGNGHYSGDGTGQSGERNNGQG